MAGFLGSNLLRVTSSLVPEDYPDCARSVTISTCVLAQVQRGIFKRSSSRTRICATGLTVPRDKPVYTYAVQASAVTSPTKCSAERVG
jgi:hypothetical protein